MVSGGADGDTQTHPSQSLKPSAEAKRQMYRQRLADLSDYNDDDNNDDQGDYDDDDDNDGVYDNYDG